ncbi:hypothetical protein QMK33_06635 [Hymenobacter sp. H14-R3]|uniref:hypothetical protein n=1 Tax=Hymenobacter sp. H14-R3 TaxID=3046308 RepID=UPI0024BBCD8C|nr:hypothetical protein [Hymenobacter sp. H14-R3]MDJ0364823.1 hypothetical protein [Hymenobacter sp. H14-R3]
MISTHHPNLPAPADLQRLCQALAALDAINSPDAEYRYYTYTPEWSDHEAVFEMSDGEGDQLLVLFRPEGCVINGYLLGYDEPIKTDLIRGLPIAFQEFMLGEPVASIGTTFCLWHSAQGAWQIGTVEDEDNGSEELLDIFDGNPATYAEWATEYYTDETDRVPITAAAVTPLYLHETLTRAHALALNNELTDWPALAAELEIIGYPYAF